MTDAIRYRTPAAELKYWSTTPEPWFWAIAALRETQLEVQLEIHRYPDINGRKALARLLGIFDVAVKRGDLPMSIAVTWVAARLANAMRAYHAPYEFNPDFKPSQNARHFVNLVAWRQMQLLPAWTAPDAASVVGCTESYLRRLARQGRITARKNIYGAWEFHPDSIVNFCAIRFSRPARRERYT